MPASFVEAAGHLAQTVNDVLFLHGVCPAVAIRRQKGDRAGLDGQVQHHALSREGSPEHKTLYHKQSAPLSQKLFSEAGHAGRRVRRPPGRCAMLRKTAFWPLPVWYALRPGRTREKTVRTIQQNRHFRRKGGRGACLGRGEWYIIKIF